MATNGKEFELAIRIAGKLDQSMGKAFGAAQKMAETAAGATKTYFKAAGIAAGVVGAGVVMASKALYDLGAEFDEAYDAIRVGTGATGEDLAALEDSMKRVYSSVPGEMATRPRPSRTTTPAWASPGIPWRPYPARPSRCVTYWMRTWAPPLKTPPRHFNSGILRRRIWPMGWTSSSR